jgi:hypothetical protein
MKQKFTSAKTSVNQIPRIFKLIETHISPIEWVFVIDVLDYGGGKYDTLTDKFAKMGIRNWIYDPFNRSKDHNKLVKKLLQARPADAAICSNVLNVIKEPKIRKKVLLEIKRLVKINGFIYTSVYEGDESSKGRKTSKGWQSHRPTKNYLREIKKVFPMTTRQGKLIISIN